MPSVRKIVANPRHYLWLATTKLLPNYLPFNYAMTVFAFRKFHGRWPRRPNHAKATFNDYIYHRMIRKGWSGLEYRAVDKELAKGVAKDLYPGIRIPETAAIIDLATISQKRFLSEIGQFVGKALVAKTTYGSGDVIFLRKHPTLDQLIKFYRLKNWHHFHAMRETQYAPLAKRVIIENELPEEDTTDYKFFCAQGATLACQINIDRFGDHRKLLVSIPDFKPLNAAFSVAKPNKLPPKPRRWDEMIHAAQKLSAPFEFVRVDLYNARDGVFFGEFTLAPDASLGFRDETDFGFELLKQIRDANGQLSNG